MNSNEIVRQGDSYWTMLLPVLPVDAVDGVDCPSVCFTVSTSPQICTPDPVGTDSVSGSAFCGRVSTTSLEPSAVFVHVRQLAAAALVVEVCEPLAWGGQVQLDGDVKLTSRNLMTRSGAASFCCGVTAGVVDAVGPLI
jgi:hypothetical protein